MKRAGKGIALLSWQRGGGESGAVPEAQKNNSSPGSQDFFLPPPTKFSSSGLPPPMQSLPSSCLEPQPAEKAVVAVRNDVTPVDIAHWRRH